MKIELRDTTSEDAQAIFELRWDSRLENMQYPPFWFETPQTLISMMRPSLFGQPNRYNCLTITLNGEFAGNISESFNGSSKRPTLTLGWNIVPELWGKGIATEALRNLLERRFDKNNAIEFIACCFESNSRCIRVIEKLSFVQQELRASEKIMHFSRTWGKQRVIKFGLTYEQWKTCRIGYRE